MDVETLGAALALTKKIPGSAAADAIEAKEAAETAAELARQYGYLLTINGDTLIIGEED